MSINDWRFLVRTGDPSLLPVLLWILGGIGIICVFVFTGKRKGKALLSDRETLISEAATNIASVAFILSQLLFPLYGYVMSPTGSIRSYVSTMGDFKREFGRAFTEYYVNLLPPFDLLRGESVYLFVIIIAVFCFFAGMHIYKNGLKIRHKIFLLIPVLVLAASFIWSYCFRLHGKRKIIPFIKYQTILQIDCIVRYLLCAFVMTAFLYGIYLLLKKLLKNEIVPLIVILLLSFLSPYVHVLNDGISAAEPKIGHLLFGPDIPLFPIGMMVMKYKDKLLPKTKKGTRIHIVSWSVSAVISFLSVFGIEILLANQAGIHFSNAYSCFVTPEYLDCVRKLDKIFKFECIPWLFLGFTLSMLILVLALHISTGNPVTKFIREHCYLVTVFMFSRHIFFEVSGYDDNFWTKVLKIPEAWTIIVPIIYFAGSVVLAVLIKRFVLDKPEKTKTEVN